MFWNDAWAGAIVCGAGLGLRYARRNDEGALTAEAVAPLLEGADEVQLANRGQSFDVVVDVVEVERQHLFAEEFRGSWRWSSGGVVRHANAAATSSALGASSWFRYQTAAAALVPTRPVAAV